MSKILSNEIKTLLRMIKKELDKKADDDDIIEEDPNVLMMWHNADNTHYYDEGVVTKQPTCTETGIKTFTCTKCNTTRTEDIAALGHNYVNGKCTRCGDYKYKGTDIANWMYTLDDTNNTVTLNGYNNLSSTSIVVYPAYTINGKTYRTILKSDMSGYFWDSDMYHTTSRNVTSIEFKEGIDTSNVTNMTALFNCNKLTTLKGLEYFNTSNVTNMQLLFNWAQSIESLDLRSFNTSKVTNMTQMFCGCNKLNSILVTNGKWVIPSGCDTTNMFLNCNIDHVTYA